MDSLQNFISNFNWDTVVNLLLTLLAIIPCFTIHELSHALAAYRLGDPTAKDAGRLTLNPLRHIDPLGFLLMLVARLGWAKGVPVNPDNFSHPKRDMALTSLAGPMSNFLFGAVLVGIARILYQVLSFTSTFHLYLFSFFLNAAYISISLGVFNLIPIPPLDGSKVLFALLPQRAYNFVLRYERYGFILLYVAVWTGILSVPMNAAISALVRGLCTLCRFPAPLINVFL